MKGGAPFSHQTDPGDAGRSVQRDDGFGDLVGAHHPSHRGRNGEVGSDAVATPRLAYEFGIADPRHCEVSDKASVTALVEYAGAAHGCPDRWANNAGISGRTIPTVELTR